jgi:4-hydroxybenzoate polyprenyltransferase
MNTLQKILEMIRFSHTLFALPFALLAAVMAWTVPADRDLLPVEMREILGFRWQELLGLLLCMVFARSTAMAFNRLVDRDVDAKNPRTEKRHLVTGELSATGVIFFLLVTAAGFVASTVLFFPNRWPLYLAVPVLVVLCLYSLTKRFTALSHFWLGAALMLAPICAWIALRGPLVAASPADILPALLVGMAVLLWVAGFDIIYACQDAEFDRQNGLFSVPSRIGIAGALRVAAWCHAGMVLVLAAMPWFCPQVPLGWIYAVGIAAVAGLLVYEHRLVSADDLQRVNRAFFNVNSVVSLGLLVVVTVDLLI